MLGRRPRVLAVGLDVPDEESRHSLGTRASSLPASIGDGGHAGFAFKHSVTRDVAYATLPRGERRALHRRVAEWVQRVAPDRGRESAELAAYHYHQAIAYGEEDQEVAAAHTRCSRRLGGGHEPRCPVAAGTYFAVPSGSTRITNSSTAA